ncbi:MAG: elongation factor P [Micropruina glycogenica]
MVPAPQAGQGQHRGAYQAQARAERQGRRPHVQPDTKVDTATVDRREMQYLYHDGDGYVFMDTATYDQLTIPDDTVGDAKGYLLENGTATVAMHEGNPLYIDLPASVELEVTYTEPGLQGDRSTGGTKPATLETGVQIQVPLFITTGERVKVDTRDGSYLGRV